MERIGYTIALSLTLALSIEGFAGAAQLDGVQIKPGAENVQIILDTDKDQNYRIERQGNAEEVIILPKAKLPAAFQDTGLPPVTHRESGVTANIEQTAEGVRIRVKGDAVTPPAYEVKFKQAQANQPPLPQSPLALMKPEKQEINDLFSQLQKAIPQKAWQPAPSQKKVAAKPKAAPQRRTAAAVKPAARPVAYQPRVQQAVAVERPAAEPAIKAATPPAPIENLEPKTDSVPAEAPAKPEAIAAAQPKVKKTDGVNFQAYSEEAPAPSYGQTQRFKNPAFSGRAASTGSFESRFGRSVLQWVFVSAALLGGLILLAVGLAVMSRKRMGKKLPNNIDAAMPAPEYFEEANLLPKAPQPRKSKALNAILPVAKPAAKAPEASPPDTAVPPIEQKEQPATPKRSFAEHIAPQAVAPKQTLPAKPPQTVRPQPQTAATPANVQPQQPQAPIRQQPMQTPMMPAKVERTKPIAEPQQPSRPAATTSGRPNVLAQPPASISQAVKSSLGSQANPYVKPPFKINPPKSRRSQGSTGPQPNVTTSPAQGFPRHNLS